MPVQLLAMHRVEKPWGRHRLWPGFDDPAPDGEPVGEIWFQEPGDATPDLLIKYLFTSEKLSVQVHPDDAAAQARGLPRGKDECWLILDAEPESTIAIGPRARVDADTLRSAARDGSIVDLLDWKPVRAGDFIYAAAGTVHAIGAGITLIEVQQNSDTTYRLYDYGRPRELHLEDGVDVAVLEPWVPHTGPGVVEHGRTILVEGPKFVLERWIGGDRMIRLPHDAVGWLIPVQGRGAADGLAWQAGDCLSISGSVVVTASPDADLLFAYPGDTRI
ncbi:MULTISPECIES: class I mannose-6-phosphate isomerase [unclassified Sphingomonas]|uniref:class I mannose-6-phosphate isomerase n=1 Tax=unclassified Sphingomonas TaxID=196159 RepID=UPI002150D206|nr:MULTISPECIES: class I mannose-6-phosphate isomerase [unclassified Sphingomonas]MCR5871376.1 class I mannose-6-phosphate isomerase [Sphingomonas sp. J344]UUY00324.1 class I mannose-6-phosphate isomerase [Sphingomonas sp. J315]